MGDNANDETIRCPVDRCSWSYERPQVQADAMTLADVFGVGVVQATQQHQALRQAEQAVARHMDTHSPEQFLRTITRLTQQRDEAYRALAVMEQIGTVGRG